MSTDILEFTEIDLTGQIEVLCDYEDGNEAKWIFFYKEEFDCCGPKLLCNNHHDYAIWLWNAIFRNLICGRCGKEWNDLFISIGDTVLRIEQL